MQIFENHTSSELTKSLEAELAKALNEIRCAEGDLRKANSRLKFALSLVHHLSNTDLKEED